MNKLFTKIAAILSATMAVGVGVAAISSKDVSVTKADTDVTFTPGTDTGATSVTKSGVTVTMTTMNNSSYYQIYAGQSGTFSVASGNVTKIEFTCTASGTSKYGPGNTSANVGSYTYSGSKGTWTGSASSVTLSSTAQVRMTSLTVSYSSGTTPTPLSTPTGLSASGTTMSWNDVSNESGYAYSIVNTSTSAETTGSLSANTTSFDASTLTSLVDGNYTFKVKATGDGTNYSDSPYTSTVNFTISTSSGGDSLIITADYLGLDTTGIGTTATDLTGTDGLKFNAKAAGSGNKVKKQARASTTKNHFSTDGFVLMGKNGAYIYNKTEFDYPIKSFNVVTNGGSISTNVVVAVGFGTSEMTDSLSGGTQLNAADTVFNYALPDATTEYTYFRIQVTSAHNAQIQIKIEFELPSTDPEISISTASTSVTWDGSSTQTIAFSSTVTNFSDDAEDIAYEWRSSNTNAISVTNVGSESTANLKVVGAGNATITCYALGLSGDEATSEGVQVTVSNETYSGSLSITTSGDILTGSEGEIEYTLTGNTHPMNTFNITSTDDDVITVNYNSSTGKFEYLAGDTPDETATVTITLSSTIYTLESYQADLYVHLIDADSVASVTTNYDNRNVKFGGSQLSFTATVTLVGGGDATGKQVTWTPTDSGVCTITPSANTLVGTVVPVNVGSTTVRVASVDDPTKYHDVTVNVAAPDTKTLNSITINKGDGYKTSYYDDAESVDLTGLSLTVNYINANYPTYSENVNINNDASGVVWTLDLTNKKVKVAYTVDQTTVRDEFGITVTEAPTLVTFDLTSTGFKGTDIASENGAVVSPFTLIATATGSNAWRSNAENLRMYSGNAMTLSGDSSVASIDIVYITPGASYSCSSGYTYTAMPSEESLTYDSELGGLEMPEGTTSLVIARTGNRADLASIVVEYTKVQIIDDTVTDITLTPASVALEVGETQTLTSAITPVGAAGGEDMIWHTTSSSVATVDSGTISAVGVGTCEIYSVANDEGECESNHVTVTVTAAPIVNFAATEAVQGNAVKLGGVDFLIDTESSYRALAAHGAQFGSGADSAGTVSFTSTDYAFNKTNLKVVVNATFSGDGGNNTVKAFIGDTQIGETASMTKNTPTDFVFEYSGTASNPIPSTDLIRIEINNDVGAVYLKTLKVYSSSFKSVIADFTTNSLRMESYDQGGSEGSTGGNGSCKTWWNDVLSSYNGLTNGQKSLFGSEDKYIAARARLSEWARINGYTFNPSDGTISKSGVVNPLSLLANSSGTEVAIIVVTSMIGLSAVGGYFFLRKRKEI